VIWTIRSALEWTQGYLAQKGEENPRLAAQWLLAAATGLERIELYTRHDQPLSEQERVFLREAIRRRILGEPLQYILGRAPFRRLELKVRPGVLIPRPETEVLVEWLIGRFIDQTSPSSSILEIGTGTGAIALALLHELPSCLVVATDIDSTAIELARENAQSLGVQERLTLIEDDLAGSLVACLSRQASFDAVVSNPPYIPTEELDGLPEEVIRFEARAALDGGFDGLVIFRRILEQARVLLKPGGILACELHEERLTQAARDAELAGFTDLCCHQDLAGRDRILTARRPSI
jgi:release factor glutamine methyltransferase